MVGTGAIPTETLPVLFEFMPQILETYCNE